MKRPGACHLLLICEISQVCRVSGPASYERCYKITKEYASAEKKEIRAFPREPRRGADDSNDNAVHNLVSLRNYERLAAFNLPLSAIYSLNQFRQKSVATPLKNGKTGAR